MKKGTSNNRNSGFTLVEVLAAVAVLAILLAVSAVGVAQYRDSLKLTELDNAAREIYMAAQNRAALLSGSQRLSSLVGQNVNTVNGVDETASGRYISCDDVVKGGYGDLLPTGSIDPALLNGDFYIVYEPESGSVTDVFYAESSIGDAQDGFQAFYTEWKGKSRDERMKHSPMLGYYGGGKADAAGTDRLHTPGVTVLIHNEEELWVEVSFLIPDGATAVEKKVELQYDGNTIDLMSSAYNSRLRERVNLNSTTYAWTLDSLKNGKFSGLVGLVNGLGKDFTVTATIEVKADGKRPAEASASATGNSLFAEVSDGTTAKLMYLRHLQNLDLTFSGVTEAITNAEQQADIQCLENEFYGDYRDFQPINNTNLISFDGKQKAIRGLYVNANGNAGLFETANGIDFTDIRLVNAYVKGTEAAGALVGKAGNGTVFDDCHVYWEPTDTGSYTDLLGSNAESGTYKYQINGATAGGLAGSLGADSKIENSLSATLISGSTAGGLVGQAGDNLEASNSYADCYLAGKTCAGLVGNAGSVRLTNCYAAGFIDMSGDAQAAGLCMGGGAKVTSSHVYSVMRPVGPTSSATFWYLTQTQATPNSNTFNSTHCLRLSSIAGQDLSNETVLPYDEMTRKEFVTKMGGAFAGKSPADSHPYNLREDLQLTNYDYPGLKDLPHYGDWTAEFKEPSLVYYEKYKDDNYGFSGGNARTLVKSLADNKTIVSDGYAVALLGSDLDGDNQVGSINITYFYFDETGKKSVEKTVQRSEWLTATGRTEGDTQNKTYYLIPLPAEIPTKASADFYQYLGFTLTYDKAQTVTATGDYFYNPHFSETVNPVPAQDIPAGGWDAKSISAYAVKLIAGNYRQADLRTPRHLYELSRYPEYYNSSNAYSFRQRLDLDYSTYTEYDGGSLSKTDTFRQTPIGTATQPFRGTYNGGSHTIRNVSFQSARLDCVGLFGRSQGNLNNIIFHITLDTALTVARTWDRLYLGGLVGWNDGTVSNCAASGLKLNAISNYAPFYIGGLVGYSSGTIRDCGVEAPQLSVKGTGSTSDSYVGGLVGRNTGWVGTSYAVARIDGTVDQVSSVCTGGFVGRNEGSIDNSYAATHMTASGLNAKSSGFCGQSWATGVQTNTYYLNMGNLSYRGTPYAAVYSDAGNAVGKTFGELSKMSFPGMGYVGNDPGGYPYPTAVKDAKGDPFYPGEAWPIPLEIGEMGIYYWEKLEINGKASYNTSLLTVDPAKYTITKRNALSPAHDDGGVITEYGYGYYAADAGEDARFVSVEAKNINYYSTEDKKGVAFDQDRTQTDAEKAVDTALKDLMPGYTFHSYLSLDLDKQVGGLYPEASTSRPNGTLTLTQGDDTNKVSVTFTLNPFFADAMSVQSPDWDWKNITAPTDAPGTTAGNPYGVRAIEQLEFINWNSATLNTTTVLTSSNYGQFPYLSSKNMAKTYYWTQSHDVKGEVTGEKDENGNDVYKTYTPIAEYYDGTIGATGELEGWFGGIYNGQDYVIENVSIAGGQHGTSSVAGLFGVVYNGKLSHMVLYSSDGNGVISGSYSTMNKDARVWTAIGGLAGIAASGQSGASVIDNCSIAGYTIKANFYHAKAGNAGQNWGGAEVGGLVGISNRNLSNCTAVTNIVFEKISGDTNNSAGDNVRVGGLAGSAIGTIKNCYTGGQITFAENASTNISFENGAAIYIGGLVGGAYFKPMTIAMSNNQTDIIGANDITQNKQHSSNWNSVFECCYSYMELPKKDANNYIKSLCVIGSTGELMSNDRADKGSYSITNSYYLDSVKPTDTNGIYTDVGTSGVTPLTYEELATQGKDYLNSGITGNQRKFEKVTTQIALPDGGSYDVPGMYSYPPSSWAELQGLDYPFPTILTRYDEGEQRNVHYGRWPLNGITRAQGGKPMELDLFVNGGTLEEKLTLTDAKPNGTWTVRIEDIKDKGQIAELVPLDGQSIKNGELTFANDPNKELTIKLTAIPPTAAEGADIDLSTVGGTTTLHVTYTEPGYGGKTYTRDYTLRVTAELKLKPAQVFLFPNETLTLTPSVTNREDEPLENSELKLTSVQKNTGYITAAAANYGSGGATTFTGITLTGGETATTTPEIIGVNYRFTYNGKTYTAADSILAEVLPVNATVTPESGENGEQTGSCIINFDFGGRTDITDFAASLAPGQNDVDIQTVPGATSVRLALSGTSLAGQEPDIPTDNQAEPDLQADMPEPDQAMAPAPLEDTPEPDQTMASAPLADIPEPDLAMAPAPLEDTPEPDQTMAPAPLADMPEPDQTMAPAPLADMPEPDQAMAPAPLAELPADGQAEPVSSLEVTLDLSFKLGDQPHAFAVTVTVPTKLEETPAVPESDAAQPAAEAAGPAAPEETNLVDPEVTDPANPEGIDPAALPPEAELLPTPDKPEPDGEEEQDP